MDRPLSDQGTVLEFVSTHGYMPTLAPDLMYTGSSASDMTLEHTPSGEPTKQGPSTPIAATVASGPAFVRKMDVRRSPVPWMRFVATSLPPGGAQRKPDTTSPAGSSKRVRSIWPMSETTDGLDSLVLGSPVSPLISNTTPVFSKIRFLPLPPAAVAQASNPTGHDRPMENSPSPHHQDGEVTSAQHAPNIKDEVEAEAGDSPTGELLRALDRHTEALKEHTAALRELIATMRQARNSTPNPRVVGR